MAANLARYGAVEAGIEFGNGVDWARRQEVIGSEVRRDAYRHWTRQ
jgi:hypothetical protein